MCEIKPFTKSYAINRIAELTQENARLKNSIELITKYNNENLDDSFKLRKALAEIKEIINESKKEICKECELKGTDFCTGADCFELEEMILTKINEVLE